MFPAYRITMLFVPALICFSCLSLLPNTTAAQKPDIKGKIVLANLDRYDAIVRFGENRCTIKPGKASILTPKTYPATLDYWSGNTNNKWQKTTISKAGIVTDALKGSHATAHDLRRSFGNRWAKIVDKYELKELMRHANIETTLKYCVQEETDSLSERIWNAKSETNAGLRANGAIRRSFFSKP